MYTQASVITQTNVTQTYGQPGQISTQTYGTRTSVPPDNLLRTYVRASGSVVS